MVKCTHQSYCSEVLLMKYGMPRQQLVILFHIISVLLGYLFFQLYTLLPEGEKFLGKSLPVILKSYMPEVQAYVILYIDDMFAILSLFELVELYSHCNEDIKLLFKRVLKEK